MNDHSILLFGMPRSGTTWLGKIFDSHPDTLYRHEPDSGGALNGMPLFASIGEAQQHAHLITQFVNALPGMGSSRVAGSLPIFPKRYLSSPRLLRQRFAVMATRAAEKFSIELPIPAAVQGETAQDVRVVWKSIESLGRLGVLARTLPQSRAILILRHPCAYIASVIKGEASDRFSSSTSSSEDYQVLDWLLRAAPSHVAAPTMATLKRLHPVERLAWRWVLTNAKTLADIEGLANCTTVRYEDVCCRPAAEAQRLFGFAGLAWHPQVARFIEQCTSHHSERYYSVFKDPMVAANKWRNAMSGVDIERVLRILRNTPFANIYGNEAAPELAV